MGFLKSFLGSMVANSIAEQRREEKEKQCYERTQLENEMKVTQLERDFLNYLISINCRNADIDEEITCKYGPGDVLQAKTILNMYKNKIKEYISFGGVLGVLIGVVIGLFGLATFYCSVRVMLNMSNNLHAIKKGVSQIISNSK